MRDQRAARGSLYEHDVVLSNGGNSTLNIKLTGPHRSLSDLEWRDIPQFAVLTGLNGCGKSQLLQAIYDSIKRQKGAAELTVEAGNHPPKTALFLDSRFQTLEVDDGDYDTKAIKGKNKSWWDSAQRQIKNLNKDGKFTHSLLDAIRTITGKDPREVSQDEFIERVVPHWGEDVTDFLLKRISRRFAGYEVAYLNRLRQRVSPSDIEQVIGPPPWIKMNQLIRDMGLPFTIQDPEKAGNIPFTFALVHDFGGAVIAVKDLSSGERSLLTLCAWLFNTKDAHKSPDVLLLDEPDAHLHPGVLKELIRVLNEVVANQYNIRVIMTTHRPTTIQFVPETSLFEMRRGPLRIESTTRASSIAMLTAGLVNVLPATRFILVEDRDDVTFYDGVFKFLIYDGHIDGAVPLVFKSAGRDRRVDNSGGRNEVIKWVGKLHDAPFETLLHGIIDGDNLRIAEPGLTQLDRYCIENYLWDPIVIFHCLSQQGIAPDINGKVIPAARLKEAPQELLQSIANTVIGICETAMPDLTPEYKARVTVEFCNGKVLSYPNWLMEANSKELLAKVIGGALGGNGRVNPSKLLSAFLAVGMVPVSLAQLMQSIQAAGFVESERPVGVPAAATPGR